MKKAAEKIESNPYTFRPSDHLSRVLATLTPKQRAAIPRMVEADLMGLGREELFKGDRKICHRSVYFENWSKNPVFVAALELALAEARPALMQNVVQDTVARLKQIAPLAANDLERQIIGDEQAVLALNRVASNGKRPIDERVAAVGSLGLIGTAPTTLVLIGLLDDGVPEIRKAAAEALGRSAIGTDVQRRMADIAVLDRADKETANKGGAPDEDIEDVGRRRWEQIAPLLKQLEEAHETIPPTPISD